jgi:hypothetical protein
MALVRFMQVFDDLPSRVRMELLCRAVPSCMAVMKQHNAVLYKGTNKSEEYGDSIFRLEQILNKETARSFEMLVPIYQTT